VRVKHSTSRAQYRSITGQVIILPVLCQSSPMTLLSSFNYESSREWIIPFTSRVPNTCHQATVRETILGSHADRKRTSSTLSPNSRGGLRCWRKAKPAFASNSSAGSESTNLSPSPRKSLCSSKCDTFDATGCSERFQKFLRMFCRGVR